MNGKSKHIALCGLLTATALVLSLVERMFPVSAVIPIPGIKLGLANVVTLFALIRLNRRDALAVLLVRVTLASVFMGSITSFLFALFGGLLAMLVMLLLLPGRDRWISFIGISAAGAAAHNIGQIGAAMLVLRSVYVAAYLPLLLLSGLVMGISTGIVSRAVIEHLEKISF